MKQLISIALLVILTLAAHFPGNSQSLILPPSTLILHYRLAISYTSTTVLVFPAPVRPVDRGDRDILAQRQPGVENVLKLKAARRNFPPTNLHVFTADGRIFAFDLVFTDSLATTHDLTTLDLRAACAHPQILLSDQALNSEQLTTYLSAIRRQSAEFSVANHRYRMQVRLENIDMIGPLLFFRLSVSNRSTLDYTPDFLRFYLSDEARAKRTSRQDQELNPIYADSLTTIPGRETRTFIVALPRVTIPDQKEFRIELYEKNGGRALALRVRNRQLLRARRLSTSHSPNPDGNH